MILTILPVVTKNPLSPVEHKGGEGVAVELFEMGLDSFIVRPPRWKSAMTTTNYRIANYPGLSFLMLYFIYAGESPFRYM